uniref:Uncharacterized protein n=1 Tax=Hyaloperonospora arabidopsidis (strain Emoy2) TaxID=559515 RepID=M4B6I6_HYAAE
MDMQQVISPTSSKVPPAAYLVIIRPDVVDGTASNSAAIAQTSNSGASEHSTDRIDRLEGSIGNLMRGLSLDSVECASCHPRTRIPVYGDLQASSASSWRPNGTVLEPSRIIKQWCLNELCAAQCLSQGE